MTFAQDFVSSCVFNRLLLYDE